MARSAYSSHPGASTTTLSREPSEDSFEPRRVGLIERGPTLRIDVEHRHERAGSVEDRHHDLRLGARVARDVSGESLYVRPDYRPPLGGGGAADSAAEGDLEAAKSSLIWSDAQEVRRDNAVESRPEVPKGVLDEGCQGRHGRNVVIDARQDADQLRVQQSVRPLARLIAKVQHRFTHWSPFRPRSEIYASPAQQASGVSLECLDCGRLQRPHAPANSFDVEGRWGSRIPEHDTDRIAPASAHRLQRVAEVGQPSVADTSADDGVRPGQRTRQTSSGLLQRRHDDNGFIVSGESTGLLTEEVRQG